MNNHQELPNKRIIAGGRRGAWAMPTEPVEVRIERILKQAQEDAKKSHTSIIDIEELEISVPADQVEVLTSGPIIEFFVRREDELRYACYLSTDTRTDAEVMYLSDRYKTETIVTEWQEYYRANKSRTGRRQRSKTFWEKIKDFFSKLFK